MAEQMKAMIEEGQKLRREITQLDEEIKQRAFDLRGVVSFALGHGSGMLKEESSFWVAYEGKSSGRKAAPSTVERLHELMSERENASKRLSEIESYLERLGAKLA